MTSIDIHVVALGSLQLFYLLHGMYIINAGAGLSLISEQGFFGYLSIALFTVLFGSIFASMGIIARVIAGDGGNLGRAAYLSLGSLGALVALQLLNALSMYSQYQY